MKPVLYEPSEAAFNTNGIGILGDAISCTVEQERNGMYELELEYPVTGIHYADIALRSLILGKPDPTSEPQPFRVYDISRPINGAVTVFARHVAYDLAGIPVSPFSASSAAGTMVGLETHAAVNCPFTFWTDKSTAANLSVPVPTDIWSLLGGSEGSILDVYGGEYEFDRYTVKLHQARGTDRGVTIRYGKNLTDLKQEENCEAVYTGIYPYFADTEGNVTELPEKIVNASGNFNFTRIKVLDLSSEWEEAPTTDQLRARAEAYIQANSIGVPKVSIKVSFVQLEQSEEYKNLALLERVNLCDTVRVEFPKLGVSAEAEVVKTKYNTLTERYDSVELGDSQTNLADTILAQGETAKQEIRDTQSRLQKAIDNATRQITGNAGGYVVLHSSTGQEWPDEILIMDEPDVKTAVKVWRWNKSGLGYSGTGYNGPYALAMTQDGAFVADFITTGTLSANLIKAGILSDGAGKNSWNMLTGEFSLSAAAKIGESTITDVIETEAEEAAGTAASTVVSNYNKALNQAAVLNKLTNNGQAVGIYLQNGQLYINASYIKSGAMSADLIDVAELLSKTINVSQINIETDTDTVGLSMKYDVTDTYAGRGLEFVSSGNSRSGYISNIKAVGNDLTISSEYGIALMPGALHGAGEEIWLGGDTHVAGNLSVSGDLSVGSLALDAALSVTANETYSSGTSTLSLSSGWNDYEESLYLHAGTYVVMGSVNVSMQGYAFTTRIMVGSSESAGSRSSVYCVTSDLFSTQSAAILRLTSASYVYLSVWAGESVTMSSDSGGGTYLRAVRIFS